MKTRVVSATEFKAKCLALLDEIGHTGGTITVTKRGRPMATVGAGYGGALLASTEGLWKGKVHFPEQHANSRTASDLWEALAPGMKGFSPWPHTFCLILTCSYVWLVEPKRLLARSAPHAPRRGPPRGAACLQRRHAARNRNARRRKAAPGCGSPLRSYSPLWTPVQDSR